MKLEKADIKLNSKIYLCEPLPYRSTNKSFTSGTSILQESRSVLIRSLSIYGPRLKSIKVAESVESQESISSDDAIAIEARKRRYKLIPTNRQKHIDVNEEQIPTPRPQGVPQEYEDEMDVLVPGMTRPKPAKAVFHRRKGYTKTPKSTIDAARDILKSIEEKDRIPQGVSRTGNELYRYWTSDPKTSKMRQFIPLNTEHIPRLAHNLDRVLFSPGVHFLQDPRTRVYNFPPFLKNVISHKDFKFEALEEFKPASRDKVLFEHAKEASAKFYSSTSSMTQLLSKLYLFWNDYDPANADRFGYVPFTGLSFRLASSMIVKPQGQDDKGQTIYSMESDRSCDTEFLLSAMGMCLETLLTNPEDEFVKFHKDNDSEVKNQANVYNYATYGDFLMRSQLDCYDERLPGNGTFDLKTRAALSIRSRSHEPSMEHSQYQIWQTNGKYESFAREFRDMIRTGALMKYMFQARIGQMDGIFVAYHNISSIFGFQYLPLSTLDKLYYSHVKFSDPYADVPIDQISEEHLDDKASQVADVQFRFSLDLWQTLLNNHILKDLEDPNQPFRLVVNCRKVAGGKILEAYAVPITETEVDEIQQFPKQFATAFNAKGLTHTERLKNLKTHSESLKEFNEKITKEKDILLYKISLVKSTVNGKQMRVHHLPDDPDNWRVNYRIARLTYEQNSIMARYLSCLNYISDTIVVGDQETPKTTILDVLEKVGQLRKRQWDKQEEKQGKIVYSPKE
ncbi:uncharacterized protein SPAPADRAFT_64415 [Spathaspora passalidarum NRRL Y-27907]|uniref:Pet127-domain-containing protein n=1 Tax=Spathaspora passalidarum (strain NRRL Y-27907 / 11-Y1) TaxID=619300 RepID=G3AGC4_SPAPN|nr:uncharacterized protein SPAPADRAFT_64415 [Spathaspora passalidarum NRRL Y-27907]EGW35263.1 hypothetical protein SPAPADRAFT_64415 [Spathaspora passalidarum NRRL Y-27907]